jgi:SAM-dependent methyltransferase
MGLYAEVIFPWLCDLVLGRPFLAKYRRELLATVRGRILEIGFGTGLNLPHYPGHVRLFTAVDPCAGKGRRARRRMSQTRIDVDVREQSSECLPFADASFDCVVSTLTLCSIDDVAAALAEVYRVLRPGGRFLFLEHGVSPDPWVQAWQRRLNGLEQRLAGGCRLDRPMRALVVAQPFVSVEATESYLACVPKTHGYLYRGTATK